MICAERLLQSTHDRQLSLQFAFIPEIVLVGKRRECVVLFESTSREDAKILCGAKSSVVGRENLYAFVFSGELPKQVACSVVRVIIANQQLPTIVRLPF